MRGDRPEIVDYQGVAIHLTGVWIAVRAALRGVLESTSLADLVSGDLPAHVQELTRAPDAWVLEMGLGNGAIDAAPSAGGTLMR